MNINGPILQSKSLSFGHGQRKTVLLKIEKIGPNFFPDFLIPRALLALDVQEGWNETQIKNYKSDTQRLLATVRLVWNEGGTSRK